MEMYFHGLHGLHGPDDPVGGPRCALGVGAIHMASGAARTIRRPKPALEVIGGLQKPTGAFGSTGEVPKLAVRHCSGALRTRVKWR